MRCLLWVIAIAILVVVVIPILATAAFAALWALRLAVPILIIGLGVWLILSVPGALGSGRRAHWERDAGQRQRRASEMRHDSRLFHPYEANRTPPAAAHTASVPAPQPSDLPIEIEVKAEQIRRKVEVLLGYAERFPIFSQDLYLVRQTANDYLPRTLHAYRALAASGGANTLTSSGRTARDEIREQIDLLDAKLDEITQDLQRRDLDQLLANRRFLEERFGQRGA